MGKNIAAIVLAPIIWGLVMFPGNQVLFVLFPGAADGAYNNSYLFSALIASFLYSVIAGAAAALIAQADFQRIGLYAGLAVAAVGVSMQIAFWDVMPEWYHFAFLFWLIPMCMVGANIVRSRRAPTAT